MFEVKNASELESMSKVVSNNVANLTSQLKEAESELKLLNMVKQTSKWFDSILPVLQELVNGDRDNTEVLKKVITNTMLMDCHFTALIGFDEGWITSIQVKVTSVRRKLVPDEFHKHVHHRNWYTSVPELKDKYPTVEIGKKVDKIALIARSIESISAWCLHRVYILEENPRFCR